MWFLFLFPVFSWQINSSNCSNGRRHIVIKTTSRCPSLVTVKLINRSLKNTNRLLEICEDYAVITNSLVINIGLLIIIIIIRVVDIVHNYQHVPKVTILVM